MSYRNLDIYKMAFDLFPKVHKASFLLPKYELYELGNQLRRSADSVITNIVEVMADLFIKTNITVFSLYPRK